MNYFYLNPNAINTIMQVLIIILIILICILLFMRSDDPEDIKKAISEIDVSCPPCPTLKTKDGKCPPCICPEVKAAKAPTCPKVTCPTVSDIVGGIFPGRNRGITDNGEYFPINAYEDMEITPAYSSVIDQIPAFKESSILGIKDKDKLVGSKDPAKDKPKSELETKGKKDETKDETKDKTKDKTKDEKKDEKK